MITRSDGRILADKFTTINGITDPVRYEAAPDNEERPFDSDLERRLRPGETYARLTPQGCPILFERVWTKPENVEQAGDGVRFVLRR